MVDFTELWGGIDWAIIVVFFASMIGIGLYMKRRAGKTMKAFFVASRKLTIPILIGVAAAGWYDSWVIVGLAENGWRMGISIAFVFVIPCVFLRLPLALWIGPRVRGRIPEWVVTMPDLFEFLYDRRTKLVLAIGVLPSYLYDAALLMAGGQVLSFVTGMNIWVAMSILGVIVIIYTSLAGMWGMAVTDLIQFAIMTVAAGALCIAMLTTFGGLESIFDSIRATDPVKLEPFGTLPAFSVIAWMLAAGSLYASPQSYQRFGAAKGSLDVKISYTLMVFIGICFSAVFVLSGMVASVHFADAASPAEGFWAMVFTVLPMGLRGLFVAALLAAVMSTVSSDYLIVGAIVVQDIYKSFINKNLSDRKTVLASRIYIWIHGIGIIGATYLWHDGIGQAWFYIGGFLTAVFVVPVVMGLYYKRKTPQTGFYNLLLTMIFYIVWQFVLGGAFGIPTNLAAWTFSIVTYVIIANLTYKGSDNKSDDKLANDNV